MTADFNEIGAHPEQQMRPSTCSGVPGVRWCIPPAWGSLRPVTDPHRMRPSIVRKFNSNIWTGQEEQFEGVQQERGQHEDSMTLLSGKHRCSSCRRRSCSLQPTLRHMTRDRLAAKTHRSCAVKVKGHPCEKSRATRIKVVALCQELVILVGPRCAAALVGTWQRPATLRICGHGVQTQEERNSRHITQTSEPTCSLRCHCTSGAVQQSAPPTRWVVSLSKDCRGHRICGTQAHTGKGEVAMAFMLTA